MRTWISVGLLSVLGWGCGDDAADVGAMDAADIGADSALPDADRGDADASIDAATDTDVPDAADASDADDASLDTGDTGDSSDAGPVDLACLGERLPLTLIRDLPYAAIDVGAGDDAASGAFLLDLATTGSAVDLNAFERAPIATGCDPSRLGQICRFADLQFFGSWGSVTLNTQDFRGLGGVGVPQAGILGTDFFSLLTLTFDYDSSEVRNAPRGTLCSDEVLGSAGFEALSSAGFYSNDLSTLRPLSDVDDEAGSGITVANVPTVIIRAAGVNAFAQLDTGFDDSLVPNAINVNTAFFDAIVAADPDALVRDAGNDLALSTCVVGVTENVTAWVLSTPMQWVGSDGESVRESTDVHVFVKNTPLAARRCAGIGTWSVPAAQIAASLHATLGQFVVDPFSSRVWIRAR